jgi:hypothetical protein
MSKCRAESPDVQCNGFAGEFPMSQADAQIVPYLGNEDPGTITGLGYIAGVTPFSGHRLPTGYDLLGNEADLPYGEHPRITGGQEAVAAIQAPSPQPPTRRLHHG